MPSRAAVLKQQIEAQLSRRVPAALSPRTRPETARLPMADAQLNALLHGGLPVGAITEVHGSASSGRTSFALSLAAAVAAAGTVAAWVDTNDTFDPETAALCGVDLERLLWVRCGAAGGSEKSGSVGEAKQARQLGTEAALAEAKVRSNPVAANHVPKPVGDGGCGSPHPRGEGRGMAEAIDSLLQDQPRSAALKQRRARKMIGTPGAPNRDVAAAGSVFGTPAGRAAMPFPNASPYREEQVATDRQPSRRPPRHGSACPEPISMSRAVFRDPGVPAAARCDAVKKVRWEPLDQALRAVDLLLQAGGFSVLVLDLGDVPASMAWRIPLATWFRFRAACERSQTILLVISQHPCARASADLTVAVTSGGVQSEGGTVAVASAICIHVEQQRRDAETACNVVPLRKPVRSEAGGVWTAASPWGVRA